MKAIILTFTLLLSIQSYASCIDAYQVYTISNAKEENPGKETGKKVITSGMIHLGSGAAVYAVGYYFQAFFGTDAAYMTTLYFGTSVTTAPVITTLGTTTYLMALEYKKIQKILKQSQFGFGAEIDNLKEDIEDEVGRYISMEEFMSVLSSNNQKEVFCDQNHKLYNLNDIKNVLINELN